jgi:hypothetical protein
MQVNNKTRHCISIRHCEVSIGWPYMVEGRSNLLAMKPSHILNGLPRYALAQTSEIVSRNDDNKTFWVDDGQCRRPGRLGNSPLCP